MRYLDLRRAALLLALLCAGCGGQNTPSPTTAAPSPTIAAASAPSAGAAAPTPSPPLPAPASPRPTGEPTRPPLILSEQPAASGTAMPAGQFVYLWPAYLPPGFQPAPAESLVSRENQGGQSGMGFYIITLNEGARKLTIGGGDLPEALPLTGEERRVEVGGRAGRLVTSGDRRQIVFDVPQGQLFIYGAGLSEEELLKVGESLQPADLQTLRALAGAQ